MALRLTIENETSLPDGGPLSVEITGQRGIDIGRDQYLDWCLPDPTRTISGKHCEVRFHDGAFWLHDVSRNGTFVNRNSLRIQEPHRLRDGDRLEIGRYVVAVQLDGGGQSEAAFVSGPTAPDQYWSAAGEAAPEISRKDLRPARDNRPVNADFIDWAVDVPAPSEPVFGAAPYGSAPSAVASAPAEDMSWSRATPPPPEPAPPPIPSPRRPPAGLPDDWSVPPAGRAPGPAPVPESDWAAAPPPAARVAAPEPDPANPWGAPSSGSLVRPRPAEAPPAIPEAPAFAPPASPPGAPPGAPAAIAYQAEPPRREAPPAGPAPRDPAGEDLLARFAKGAGIPAEIFSWRDPGDLAEEIGGLVRLSAESLKQLLNARAETKRVARTANQTMIQALDNNPLKFSPTIEDALRIMFGRPSAGYLDARRSLEQGFKDLKTHQVKTYSAMQHAIRILLHELDPDAIARSHEGDKGISGLIGSKKARLWDLYLTRWDTLTAPHEDGMVDAFMLFFAECYDRGEKGR